MNNKGQSLVAFVILLPLLIIALCFVVDMGLVLYEQHRLDQVVYDSLRYSEDKWEEQVKKNEPQSKITTSQVDTTLKVKVATELDSIFGKVIGIKKYHIVINYQVKEGNIIKE